MRISYASLPVGSELASEVSKGGGMNPTVLIVDDAPESIDVLRGLLQPEHQVYAAINGRLGLELAEAYQPHLILLDVMLPDMDGYEVCRRLKNDERTRPIPVIFITTLSDVSNEARGLSLGAVDYITKPYVGALVRSRVRTQLRLHHQQLELSRQVAERTKELAETRLEIIARLGRAAEYRDNETGLHVIRMAQCAEKIALANGASEDRAELLRTVAPMHDVGKIGIPDRVLLKPGRLVGEEWELMKTHTTKGAEIIGNHHSELLSAAAEVALNHHERWNGEGYPSGLSGTDIPYSARVVAVADVFDALLSSRPYKPAWPLERALQLIREQRGLHFEPAMVDAFFEVLPDCLEILARYRDGGPEAGRGNHCAS